MNSVPHQPLVMELYQQYLQNADNSEALSIQQSEYERIREVQQQAALQQQRALMHQQIMYYQQQAALNTAMPMYSPNPSPTSSTQQPLDDDFKAQKRAEHNAIERARRESLNSKFQQLAHSLPNLQNDRRPSKGIIIERTLEYVKQTIEKEELLLSKIDELRQANQELIVKMTSEFNKNTDDFNPLHYDDDFSCHSSISSTSSQLLNQDFNNDFIFENQDISIYMNNETSAQF